MALALIPLSEAELQRLRDLVFARIEEVGSDLQASRFLANLITKTLRRYPAIQNRDALEEGEPELRLDDLDGGPEAAASFVLKELERAARSPYFALAERVDLTGDSQAVKDLMALLDRNLRLKGILFRYRLDPEEEHAAIWSRVWEAIPKWDGRDFRAYVARIVRNHCLDEIARKKKSPGSMEDDPREARPGRGQTGSQVASRDALAFVLAVVDELEGAGRIKALDGVIFSMISQGRAVADIVEAFRASPIPSRLLAVFELLGGRCSADDVVVLRFLLDGLTPVEIERLTGRGEGAVTELAEALGHVEDADALVARAMVRPGLEVKDLQRAQRLTTNAINLCINRIRLKVWMGLVDRAYEALRRRGSINATELALVQRRCTQSPPAGCRMYKDSTCKLEAGADDIARRAGLDLDGDGVAEQMRELRRKLVEEGLGLVFPDYNACLIERKPVRRSAPQ